MGQHGTRTGIGAAGRDTPRALWITGGGSGMGRAIALQAARSGWAVAVSGRRPDVLEQTVAEITAAGGAALSLPLDVQDPSALAAAADAVVARFGAVDALVAAAGRNVPRRTWADQRMEEFEDVVATNLTAAARSIDVALPHLRRSGHGTVVAISSFAGWSVQPSAGVAYSASKTAVGSLCRTLNLQEGGHGLRATHLCPGDVATDFLDQRPKVPDAAAREQMLTAEDIAAAACFVLDAPPHVRIDELVISPVVPR